MSTIYNVPQLFKTNKDCVALKDLYNKNNTKYITEIIYSISTHELKQYK